MSTSSVWFLMNAASYISTVIAVSTVHKVKDRKEMGAYSYIPNVQLSQEEHNMEFRTTPSGIIWQRMTTGPRRLSFVDVGYDGFTNHNNIITSTIRYNTAFIPWNSYHRSSSKHLQPLSMRALSLSRQSCPQLSTTLFGRPCLQFSKCLGHYMKRWTSTKAANNDWMTFLKPSSPSNLEPCGQALLFAGLVC